MGGYALFSLRPSSPRSVFTPVALTTLDELFEAEGIGCCHLLKVDAEGAELEVLEGGRRALRATRQVVCEAEKKAGFHERVLAFLRDQGFACSVEVEYPGGVILYARR